MIELNLNLLCWFFQETCILMSWKIYFLIWPQSKKTPTNSKHSQQHGTTLSCLFILCRRESCDMDESQVLQCTKYENYWIKTCTCLNSLAYTYVTEESIIPKASAFQKLSLNSSWGEKNKSFLWVLKTEMHAI